MHIDINAILKAKAPKKQFPAFVVSFLERIVHVNEINSFLDLHNGLQDFDFIREAIKFLGCSAQIYGKENLLADENPVIFASNHPLGGLDGMIISLLIAENRSENLQVIVNDLLMNVQPLANLFAPVNKVGVQNKDYVQNQIQMWNSNKDILTFPAGACSRMQFRNGKFRIEDLEWKKSFVQKAVEYKRNIVPIYFDDQNSRFFYHLAFWRKKLNIKTNIEMLFLADEMFKAKGKHFKVYIGKPILWHTLDNSKTPIEWAEWIKKESMKLVNL